MLASAALRQPRPALMGLRGPSGTPTHRSRAVIGSARPVRRFDVLRALDRCAFPQPKLREAPLGLSLPCRALITGTPRRPRRLPGVVDGTSSPGLLAPYDTSRVRDPVSAGGSNRRPWPRAGFGYPLRDHGSHALPARQARRSVPGLLPSRVFPRRDGCPSRGPCPPGVAHVPAPPRRAAQDADRLQGFFPATSPCCTATTRVAAVAPFLGFIPPEPSPVRLGDRFVRGASPPALERRYVWPARASGSCSSHGGAIRLRIANSHGFRHLPTSTALRSPFQGRAHGFASRGRRTRRQASIQAPG